MGDNENQTANATASSLGEFGGFFGGLYGLGGYNGLGSFRNLYGGRFGTLGYAGNYNVNVPVLQRDVPVPVDRPYPVHVTTNHDLKENQIFHFLVHPF